MIRSIRLLGAALGGIVGLAPGSAGSGLFGGAYGGAFLALWVVAWVVAGFAILPYLTVVPAVWLVRRVQELSTAEFVSDVTGLLLGLLMGLLLGLPLSQFPAPLGTWLPLAVSLILGLGMMGLTVAKRADLLDAAEAMGLGRRAAGTAAESTPGLIVVEGGARFIDREVDANVTRVLQTVAGRMIFAQPRLE